MIVVSLRLSRTLPRINSPTRMAAGYRTSSSFCACSASSSCTERGISSVIAMMCPSRRRALSYVMRRRRDVTTVDRNAGGRPTGGKTAHLISSSRPCFSGSVPAGMAISCGIVRRPLEKTRYSGIRDVRRFPVARARFGGAPGHVEGIVNRDVTVTRAASCWYATCTCGYTCAQESGTRARDTEIIWW
jgi:hypothetical protein